MASTTRIGGRAGDDLADRPDVVDHAGGRLAELHEDGLDGRVGGERLLDVGRVGLRAPLVLEGRHLGAPGLVELDPALAEVADASHEHVVARGSRG